MQILTYEEAIGQARPELEALLKLLQSTVGPNGKNATVIGDDMSSLDDGFQIARRVRCENPVAQEIWSRCLDAATAQHTEVGDGTTHALILSLALILKGPDKAPDPAQSREFLSQLNSIVRPVVSLEEATSVASVAMHDSPHVGKVAKVSYEIGHHGSLTLRRGNNMTYEISNGYTFLGGPEVKQTLGQERQRALDTPLVVLVADELKDYRDIQPLFDAYLKRCDQEKRLMPLLVVCNKNAVSHDALAQLTNPKHNQLGLLPIYLVSGIPVSDGLAIADMQDVFGKKVYDKMRGIRLRDMTPDDFILAEGAVLSLDKTVVLYTESQWAEAKELTKQLEALKSAPDSDKESVKRRISMISGKTAVLYLDTETQSEFNTLIETVEDGYRAVASAMEHGVLPAGGVGVMKALREMEETDTYGCAKILGLFGEVYNPLYVPNGVDFHTAYLREHPDGEFCYDADLGEFYEGKIQWDSAKAVIGAYEHAISVATPILNTKYFVC